MLDGVYDVYDVCVCVWNAGLLLFYDMFPTHSTIDSPSRKYISIHALIKEIRVKDS